MYCLPRVFKPDNNTIASFLNGFKISDIDQLILALMFYLGLFWCNKIGRKVYNAHKLQAIGQTIAI